MMAGWYPHPDGSGRMAYWDGHTWNLAPTQTVPGRDLTQRPPQQPQAARITIHYGFGLLAIFSLLGTVIPTILGFASAGSMASDGSEGGQAAAGFTTFMTIGWLLWGVMWTLVWTAFAINHTLKQRRWQG